MDIHLLNTLGITDCAIFKWKEGRLSCINCDLDWLKFLIKSEDYLFVSKVDITSLFLNDFIIDAYDVWASNVPTSLASGIWTETNDNITLRLEAHAINDGLDNLYLVINNVERQYLEKQKNIQAARELLLTHHQIVGEHEYIRRKLDNALLEAQSYKNLLVPIEQTIHHLTTGVVILFHDSRLIHDNQSARSLLKVNDNLNSAVQISSLMKNVSTSSLFYSSLVEKKSAWQGEIFWQFEKQSPLWLHMTIHPVIQQNKLSHWIYLFSDITDIHKKQDSALSQGGMDSLTKLANRHYFNKFIQRLIDENTAFTLFLIDIRDFKKINKKLGFHSGDEILKAFAFKLQQFVGHSGFVARIGSNEFVVVKRSETLNNISLTDFTNRLIEKVSTSYMSLNGLEPNLLINIGIVKFPPDGITTDILMQHADIALRMAKYQGGNEVKTFNPALIEQHQEMSNLEDGFQKAIENKALRLYLQPIIDLATGDIVKCEALTRWTTSDGTVVSPDAFIPMAEKTGLIFPFGQWLINEACDTIKMLNAQNVNINLAINISARQCSDLKLLEQIKSTMSTHRIEPSSLSIEITESVFIDNVDTVTVILNELRNLGVKISIDDFGTGFSSLVYLKKLPIDELKIDRSFVKDVVHSGDDQAIVQAIVSLAKSLNLRIVAEGVENTEQQRFLAQNKCDYVQGFLFSKPIPVAEFIQQVAGR